MRRLAALSILIALVSTAAPVLADGLSATDEAMLHFNQGTVLYKQGKFADAQVEFQKAWDKKQTFDIAANLGDCELETGQSRLAAEHLAFAIRLLPMSAREEARIRLAGRLDEAKRRIATLRVQVTVAGARVLVNGREVGKTPLEDEVYVDPGQVLVEVQSSGYAPARKTLTLEKGAAEDVTLTLERPAQGHVEPEARQGKNVAVILVGSGVAVAALGTGVAFYALSGGRASSADALLQTLKTQQGSAAPCAAKPQPSGCAQLFGMNQDSDTFNRVGLVGVVAAGAAAGATLAYVLWPAQRGPSSSARSAPKATGVWDRFSPYRDWAPTVAPNAVGVTTFGTF